MNNFIAYNLVSAGIDILLGKNSDGSEFEIRIHSHVFISYADISFLKKFMEAVVFRTLLLEKLQTAYCIHTRFFENLQLVPSRPAVLYFTNEPAQGSVLKLNIFLDKIYSEMLRRKRAVVTGKPKTLPYIVFVQNIWDIVLACSRRKKMTLHFVDLLFNAAEQNIYFLFGSDLPYRNLLNTLVANDKDLAADGRFSELQLPRNVRSLGSEIVFTTEGVTYFREKNTMEFVSLY